MVGSVNASKVLMKLDRTVREHQRAMYTMNSSTVGFVLPWGDSEGEACRYTRKTLRTSIWTRDVVWRSYFVSQGRRERRGKQ